MTGLTALVLGGTSFVGRHLVAHLLDAGWGVTLFNRGQTNADLFPEARRLTGDRGSDVSALASGRWDVVFDVNAYLAQDVERSGEVLAARCDHYVFISTVSVYGRLDLYGTTEDGPLLAPVSGDAAPDHLAYGSRKVQCEKAVAELFPRHTIVRPSIVAGPHDPTGRFTYWAVRLNEPGAHVVPPDLDRDVQYIDARDLARWLVLLAGRRTVGVFNAAAPPLPFRSLLETVAGLTGRAGPLVPLPADRLAEEHVEAWDDLPLWLPPEEFDMRGLLSVDTTRAVAHGLRTRDLAVTAADTLAWATAEGRALGTGLSRERDAELAARYSSGSSSGGYLPE